MFPMINDHLLISCYFIVHISSLFFILYLFIVSYIQSTIIDILNLNLHFFNVILWRAELYIILTMGRCNSIRRFHFEINLELINDQFFEPTQNNIS